MIETLKLTAKEAVKALRNAGAEKAQSTVTYTVTHEFNVDGGEFSLFRTQFSDSLSLTVFVGDKKGTVNLNSFEESSLNEAVKTAIASANAAEPDPDWQVAPKEDPAVFIGGAVDGDNDRLFERFREFIDTVKADYPLILMEQAITSHSGWCNVYVNASGTEFAEYDDAFMKNLARICCGQETRAFFDEKMPDGSVVHSFARRIGTNPVTGATAAAVAVLSVTEPGNGAPHAEPRWEQAGESGGVTS